jgi:Flp pilus assembly pilin Flp
MWLPFTGKNSNNNSDSGASMVEYALLIVLIAIIALIAVQIAGESVSTSFDRIADSLANPPN